MAEARGDREAERGKKFTVYLKASQVRQLEESGLLISDVIERGFSVIPISKDGTVPPEYRSAMEYLARAAAGLANGGQLLTPYATPEALQSLLETGAEPVIQPGELRSQG